MNMERLPEGYKITQDGITLEIKRYLPSGPPICHCSGCGMVTPVLQNHTKESYEEFLKFHNSMFRSTHEENLKKTK